MNPYSSSRFDIQDLVIRINLISESLEGGSLDAPYNLIPHEERKLLLAIRNLAEKLDGSDNTVWKIIFGVMFLFSITCFSKRCIDKL